MKTSMELAGEISKIIADSITKCKDFDWAIYRAEALIDEFVSQETAKVIDKHISDAWMPIETAPKDGTEITILLRDGEESNVFWSERPVCMLGNRRGGFPEGWASDGSDCDYNLPICDDENPATHWHHKSPAPTQQKEGK